MDWIYSLTIPDFKLMTHKGRGNKREKFYAYYSFWDEKDENFAEIDGFLLKGVQLLLMGIELTNEGVRKLSETGCCILTKVEKIFTLVEYFLKTGKKEPKTLVERLETLCRFS